MDLTSIVVACISAAGAFCGTYLSIRKQNSLVSYRLDELTNGLDKLTEKVELHNNFGVRLAKIEQELAELSAGMQDVEQRLRKKGLAIAETGQDRKSIHRRLDEIEQRLHEIEVKK